MSKGIYKITCVINDVVYIGSTAASFKKRWKKHKQRLRNNKHENNYLQNAWNKYGEENFVFKEVEVLDEECELKIRERESFWLNKYFPKGRKFCFNLSDHTCGGNTIKDDIIKKKHSEGLKASYTPELRKKRSEQLKSRLTKFLKLGEEARKTDKWKKAHLEGVRKLAKDPKWLQKMKDVQKKKQVPVHTDTGEYYDSVAEAAKSIGRARAGIRACINGKTKSCAGRKWFYTEKK